MLLGYNHNITYKGEVFHVQTEDSGIQNPHVITLLYRDGVILCSKKTSYADILKIDTLEVVVEELMKEQHKEMMRRLKSGEFDDRAFSGGRKTEPLTELKDEILPAEPSSLVPTVTSNSVALLFQEPVQSTGDGGQLKTGERETSGQNKDEASSLDAAILNFFGASK